jgi:pimeloyl-ACP methyl ester carboxylesterase
MVLLHRRLGTAGFQTHQFSYRSVLDGVEANARRLAEFLHSVPGETVHLIGHSLGGVITVKALQDKPIERIGRIVCLGAPLQGSCAARAVARLPGGRWLIGKSMLAFLGNAVDPWTAPMDLGLIAGSSPVGGGQLLGLASPHDGIIAVEETRLEGATEHIVVRVSHLSMLWSRAVANQVVSFLESGRFFDPVQCRHSESS